MLDLTQFFGSDWQPGNTDDMYYWNDFEGSWDQYGLYTVTVNNLNPSMTDYCINPTGSPGPSSTEVNITLQNSTQLEITFGGKTQTCTYYQSGNSLVITNVDVNGFSTNWKITPVGAGTEFDLIINNQYGGIGSTSMTRFLVS